MILVLSSLAPTILIHYGDIQKNILICSLLQGNGVLNIVLKQRGRLTETASELTGPLDDPEKMRCIDQKSVKQRSLKRSGQVSASKSCATSLVVLTEF